MESLKGKSDIKSGQTEIGEKQVESPTFEFEVNHSHDINIILCFAEQNEPAIPWAFPELEGLVGEELKSKINEIVYQEQKNIDPHKYDSYLPEINKIPAALSKIMDEDWEGFDKFKVYMTLCPIKPRYLQEKSFAVGANDSEQDVKKTCAHELIHFLYFKKWQKLFPEDSEDTYDYPHPNWVLSELLVHLIMNDERIQKFTDGFVEEIYPGWKGINFGGKDISEIVKMLREIYESSENFDDFLRASKEKYEELDQKYQVTKQLTSTSISK